jgi:hypothetical protein
MGFRKLKATVRKLLEQNDFPEALAAIRSIPGRQAVNPLFSIFFSGNERVRWRAVTAMGVVVAQMADVNIESARVVMRRLMWNLNDESGGIGWGSPEAMGEIAAMHRTLAEEFANIIISYINPDGNYLEHEVLQRGSLWAVGRLSHTHPDLAIPAVSFLSVFFNSPDPYLRGTSIWAAGPILLDTMRPLIKARLTDISPLRLYRQIGLTQPTVAELAQEALASSEK